MPDIIHVPSTTALLLGSRIVHEGDQLTLQVVGGWIEGVARYSRTGWYLLTAAQVRVRLSAGLVARWGGSGNGTHSGERQQDSTEAERRGSNERHERLWFDEARVPI